MDFENGNPEFIDRSLFDPLFEDAENKLKGRRLYVEHTYQFKLKDSLGNNGTLSDGDVQWMTAGSGIIHQEMPLGNELGQMHGFQLWANLPREQK